MKKARIILSIVGFISIIAAVFAFNAQHKYAGSYFCTAIYGAIPKFAAKYTTSGTCVTLYCTLVATAPATKSILMCIDA